LFLPNKTRFLMIKKSLNRKQFLGSMLSLAGTGALFWAGCSSDDSGTTPTPGGQSGTAGSSGTAGTAGSGQGGSAGSNTSGSGGSSGEAGSAGNSGNAGAGNAGSSGTGGQAGSSGEMCGDGTRITAVVSGAQHVHVMYIPVVDVMAGVEKAYETEKGAGIAGGNHCHTITLTAEDFKTLQAGGSVSKITCNGGDHEFVFSCSNVDKPPVAQCPASDTTGTCTP
jgi:hypothetical protein